MKIVTYNVNGLRQRVSQHGSLLKLLNSLDADIICFQETKLQRQDLSVDVTMVEGYEAFFSCTRTSSKGRLGYSGVATFCRVSSAFSTKEVALPVAAEEGFTGLLESSKMQDTVVSDLFIEKSLDAEGIEHVTKENLLKVDSEGRCIITDHGHFVLFNLYGPRADGDDKERTNFKYLFYKLLQMDLQNTPMTVQLGRGARIQLANAIINTGNAGATNQSLNFPEIAARVAAAPAHRINSEGPARRPHSAEISARRVHPSAPRATAAAENPRKRTSVFERLSQPETPTTKRIVAGGKITVVPVKTTTLQTRSFVPEKNNPDASSSGERLNRRQKRRKNAELGAQQRLLPVHPSNLPAQEPEATIPTRRESSIANFA